MTNRKCAYFAPLFLLLAAGVFAQEADGGAKKGFAGLGPEINGYARMGFSLGGALMLGLDLNGHFSTGLKTAFFDNFDTVSSFETLLFFRYYLPWLRLPKSTDGPFAQAEAGSVVLFERGNHKNLEAFPSFSGGLSAGWRFNFGKNWYVEPAARAGYPYIWGVSVTAGIRLKHQSITVIEQIKEPEAEHTGEAVEETGENEIDGMKIIRDNDGNLRLQLPPVIFPANRADFAGLSGEITNNNYETIRLVAAMLARHQNCRIIIEGHANPTTREGGAREREQSALARLSGQRALKAQEELTALGVSSGRISIMEAGFSGTIAPYNDYENNWKNRRVEFILIWE